MTRALPLMMVLVALAGCRGGAADSATAADDGKGGDDTDGADGSDGGPTSCFDLTPTVEIGTGEVDFEEITPGAAITMVHGPQGGWHMLGSVRTTNLEQIIQVHFTIVHLESGTTIADNTYRVATVYDEAACSGVYPGMYGYLSVGALAEGEADTPPELLSHDTVEYCMTATDQQNREASACIEVVAAPDPDDVADGLAEG